MTCPICHRPKDNSAFPTCPRVECVTLRTAITQILEYVGRSWTPPELRDAIERLRAVTHDA